jgi:hypothetical protein
MDKFIRIKRQKKDGAGDAGRKFYANALVAEELAEAVLRQKVPAVCVHGGCGVGKSFIVDAVLERANVFEVHSEYLRSRAATVDVLEKLRSSDAHVLFDDFDTDSIGFREVMDRVNAGGRLSRSGTAVFVSRTTTKFEKVPRVEVGRLSVNDLVRMGRERCPGKPLVAVTDAAKKSRGNVQNFLTYLEFSDRKDIFKTPKDFVHDLLCGDVRWPEDPRAHLCEPMAEHGYSWGIVHENYPDASTLTDPGACAEVADWMSYADVIDTRIYEGDWEMSKLFSMYGIVMPAIRIDHALEKAAMRPGSSWTKFSNYKMRMYRLRSMTNRRLPIKVDLDYVQTFQTYNLHRPSTDLLRVYGLEGADLDVMNHLCLKTKLKPKQLTKLKKELKHECEKSCSDG